MPREPPAPVVFLGFRSSRLAMDPRHISAYETRSRTTGSRHNVLGLCVSLVENMYITLDRPMIAQGEVWLKPITGRGAVALVEVVAPYSSEGRKAAWHSGDLLGKTEVFGLLGTTRPFPCPSRAEGQPQPSPSFETQGRNPPEGDFQALSLTVRDICLQHLQHFALYIQYASPNRLVSFVENLQRGSR